jgi:predicted Zn-dependent protease
MSFPKRLFERTEVPDGAVLSRNESKSLIDRVVKMSKAESVQVNVGGGYSANVRFADNQMSTAGGITDYTVVIQSSFGKKHSVVTINDVSDEALQRAVKQSEDLAKLAPDDPEAMPALPPQQYQEVNAYFDSVANLTPADRAKAALTALDPRAKSRRSRDGRFLVTNASSTALGNDKGMFAYYRSTNANYTVTVRTKDGTGSGWAGGEHNDWSQLDIAGISQRALEKAKLSRAPVAIEPGRYTVILEPQAVGDLSSSSEGTWTPVRRTRDAAPSRSRVAATRWARRSWTSGQPVLRPFDPRVLSRPFGRPGLPVRQAGVRRERCAQAAVLLALLGAEAGKVATGAPTSYVMSGGDASVEDMIKGTERGVLVTRSGTCARSIRARSCTRG